jgi:hypothetical protein
MNIFRKDLEPSYFYKSVDDLIYPQVFGEAFKVFLLNPSNYSPSNGQITSQSQLDSEKVEFLSDLLVSASDFADSNWTANGWDLNNLDSELQSFADSNLVYEDNGTAEDLNVIVVRKTIDSVPYTVIFIYVGNDGGLNLITGYEGLLGSTGLTQIVFNSEDDSFRELDDLPFDFYFFGTNYKNSIYMGSNTYFTFGFGSGNFSGLSASNPGRAIHIGSADNSWQRVWAGFVEINGSQGYRIRYEGTNSTVGTPGSPNIVIETTFFEGQKINVTLGVHARTNGQAGITDGSSYQPTFTLTQNTSYAMFSDATGNNWVVEQGKYFG